MVVNRVMDVAREQKTSNADDKVVQFLVDGLFMAHTVNGHNARQAVVMEYRSEPEIGHVTTQYHSTGEKTVLVRLSYKSKENAALSFVLRHKGDVRVLSEILHGGWSEFGPYKDWSDCSVTCGNGVQQGVRTRVCNNPEPQNGGNNCEGLKDDKKERICNSQPCPVNGKWSSFVPFGDWSQCSSSCNNGTKTRVRIRTCTEPAPLYGGKPCVGQSMSMETMICNLKVCVVNGQWSSFVPYGDWSQCSSSCNNGTKTRVRIRTCSIPAPFDGGKQCVGQSTSTETTTCNIQPCSEQIFFSRTSTIIIAVVSTILVFLVPTLIFFYCRSKKTSKSAPTTQTQSEIYEEIHNMDIMSNHYVPSYAEYILHPRLINRYHPNATVQPLFINVERTGPNISNRRNEYHISEITEQGDGDQTNRESLLSLKNSLGPDDEKETKLAIRSSIKAEITSDDTELRNFSKDGFSVDEYQKPMFKRRNSYISVLPDESKKEDETVIEEQRDYLECFYDKDESVKCKSTDSKLPSHSNESLNNIGDVA
ncbi:A disintegrin and metalloproteinase with thrombospondin motifs 12-like [Saccostrea cucullata]|uniref:A disintegrin and metalloproteinase with thrombospondin motifs 12-like n=1 Tax=Saccostrea cuccullata TaxID=36930 RepID=UPI002ED5B0E3